MTTAAPRVDLDAIRHGVSLLDLLPADAAPRPNGSKQWVARCSFHDDARPSMSVRYVRTVGWVYRCFVCGASGDVIRYFCETRGVVFRDGVRLMAGGRSEFLTLTSDSDLPREMRDRSPVLLVCEGKGCGASVGLDLADVPLLGLEYSGRGLFDKIRGWRFAKAWPEDARALCPPCDFDRLSRAAEARAA